MIRRIASAFAGFTPEDGAPINCFDWIVCHGNPFSISTNKVSRLALDFKLAASNVVSASSGTVTVTPFFRGAGARPDGYGLGLAIARRSIEAHGGVIHANNRTGGGLSVELVLPWRGRASPESSPP
jgi:hypothetical protein